MALQKILLVDDDRAMRYYNSIMLKRSDITCTLDECRNGREALAYIKNTETLPDVILLDINMPVMDGHEFLHEYNLRTDAASQPRIFMLSSSDLDIEKCKQKNYPFVKGYFEKPLTEEHIAHILSCF